MTKAPKVTVVIPTRNRRQQLLRLIDSLEESSYKDIEIIVVNDGGVDPQITNKKVKLISHEENKGLAFSRTAGGEAARGEYILFIDDDNVVDKDMLGELVECLEREKDLISVGPLTFYFTNKEKIWFAGSSLNLMTTIPSFRRSFTKNDLSHTNLLLTDNLHNCFMVRKNEASKAMWFDPFVFMNGTEFDLFQRMKRKNSKGYLAVCVDAKSYHDVPEFKKDLLRSLGFENKRRVYYFQRNRGLHVGRYGTILNKLSLFIIFYPLFAIVYTLIFLYYRRIDYALTHLRATVDGYKLLLSSFI